MSEDYTLSAILALPSVTFDGRRDLPNTSAVYFVVDPESDMLFYVGKAQALRARWMAHHRAMQMQPHYRIYWMEFNEEATRTALELKLIGVFVPPWNSARIEVPVQRKSFVYRQTISDEMAAKLAAICQERGVSLQELTLIALFQLLDGRQSITPPTPAEETRGNEMLSFD